MEFVSNLLERVNPVYNTAKMTIFQLADIGDEDAENIARKLGLTYEETQASAGVKPSDEQRKIGGIMMEARYRTTAVMAEKCGYGTLIDLPCGYTPRAIEIAKKRVPYYGLDLPATIADIEWVTHDLTPQEFRSYVHYNGVDATNYDSLEKVLNDIEGEICITTEGLLMYFTDSEVDAMCDNMRKLLEKHGGCWIMSDPETTIQYVLTAQTLYGDRFMEFMMTSKQNVENKSDVEVGQARILVKPGGDTEEKMKQSMGILASHGLKAERLTVADYMPELESLKDDPETAAAYKEAMKQCAYWKVTLADGGAVAQDGGSQAAGEDASDVASRSLKDNGGEAFDVRATMDGEKLVMTLIGRCDTLTSPEVLSLFEETEEKETIGGVQVDCSSLEYISSAGLRVLLIMHKRCPDGVRMTGMNALVMDILEQTGFADIFILEE